MSRTAAAEPRRLAPTMIPAPDTRALAGELGPVVTDAQQIVVRDNETLEAAGTFLRRIKTACKRIDETFDPIIALAHQTHKALCSTKKELTTPLTVAEAQIKNRISNYTYEQERLRLEEERRLRELAREEEEERRLQEAIELERAGTAESKELAAAALEAPIEVPVVVVPTQVAKPAGISTRKAWKYRVVDESAIPREYLMVDDKKVAAVVRALNERCKIPGVEVYCEDIVSARAF